MEESLEFSPDSPSPPDRPEPLSVIIPAYNEAGGITEVVQRLTPVLAGLDRDTELLVVDDGSADDTAALAEKAGARVVRHERNRGYGASLKSGIRRAQHDLVAILDADCTYPPEALPELLESSADNDMVVGARTKGDVRIPLIRRPAKAVLRWLASYLSGYPIPDLNSGFRVMRRPVVNRYLGLLPSGFSFTTTITLAMLVSGFGVKYVPIEYHDRAGKSHIRPIRDTLGFFALILRTVMYFNPLRIFIPIALAFVAAGIMVFGLSWAYLERPLDTTSLLLLVTGIQLGGLGMLADLIAKRSSS
jgi:glycosyltransferase involved in cell wall biosynthesis